MRFVHVNHRYFPYVGGSERYMQEVSSYFAGVGHDVSVVTSNASDLEYFWDAGRRKIEAPEHEYVDNVSVHRVQVRHFPLSPLVFQGSRRLMGEASRLPLPARPFDIVSSRLPWMPSLGAAINRLAPVDLVHAANLGLEGLAVAAARQADSLRVPFVLTPFLHLGGPDDNVARRYVSMPHQKKLLQRAAHVIVMTQIEANFAISQKVDPDRVTISGVGINPIEVCGGNGDRFRCEHGISGALIGTAGAVAFEKGSRDLVLAVADLRKRGHAVELALAGPRLQQFDNWFATLDNDSKSGIHLLGFIDSSEKRDMLAALDVLAMPSRTESFGIAYLEGWANRKPVIAARAGAVPELVRDGENGVLVEFGDVTELSEGILRFLSDPEGASRMGNAGYDLTLERFTWPLVLERVRDAYSCALGFEVPEINAHA